MVMSSNSRNELLKALEDTDPGDHLPTILHFYAFDLEKLKNCYDMVMYCVMDELQARVKIDSYGSVLTGLALKESDIDLYLRPSTDPPILYDEVVKLLRRSKCFSQVTPVRNARVPIIQCIHNSTGLSIDLNMSNPHGVYNSRFVAELLESDKRLRELFLFLKIWAKELNLIGRFGMSSHCLVSMIIFSLQVHELLPSVQEMQSICTPIISQGNNFAYHLLQPPMVPEGMSTRQLITNFFDYYSIFDFKNFIVSPFFGRCLNRCRVQLDFQLDCNKNICVQDPFELKHNLAKSFSERDLHYFRECLVLAAQAYKDEHLIWQPTKLYVYLLFGIAEKFESLKLEQQKNQREQLPRKPTALEKLLNMQNNQREQLSRKPTILEKLENTQHNQREQLPRKPQTLPPVPMTFFIHFTHEDYQGLRPYRETLFQNSIKEMATYRMWFMCQLASIREVLTEVYGLKIESEESQQNSMRMLFSGQVDNWSGRDLTPKAGQTFLSHQLQQSRYFSSTRPANPAYAVRVRAYLTATWFPETCKMRIDMIPTGKRRKCSVEKLFHEFKHLMNKYSFKEQASIWSFDLRERQILKIAFVALLFLSAMIPEPLFFIILFMMAILFRKFLFSVVWNYFSDTFRFKKNELHPKHPIYTNNPNL